MKQQPRPSIGDKPPGRERVVRKTQKPCKNGQVRVNHLHMNQGSPLLPILHALSGSLHRHPSAAQGHFHTIHPTKPRSTQYPHSIYFRDQHPSIAIRNSSMLSTCVTHLNTLWSNLLANSFPIPAFLYTHQFIPNSIHSWHSLIQHIHS